MKTLLDELHAPTTSKIGFVEAAIDDVAESLRAWRSELHPAVTVAPAGAFPQSLQGLQPLVQGARPSELLVEMKGWTAYFDCGFRGPDPAPPLSVLAQRLKSQAVVATSSLNVAASDAIWPRSGSVQFALLGPLKTDWLNHVRSVALLWDGKKAKFEAEGTVQSFEEVDAYSSLRVKSRFTSEMLERYCLAMGIDLFNPAAYGDGVLIESSVPLPDHLVQGSILDAQKRLGIVPGQAVEIAG